jgi:hypothetical protein
VSGATLLPDELSATRATLHRVAVQILGRARYAASGHFGLRAGPAGIATPAFGTAPEVLRISGTTLIRESGADSTWGPIRGSSLAELAELAGVDLDAPFSAGRDAPDVGDVREELEPSDEAARVVAEWYALGWQVLDRAVESLPTGATSSTIQLWPEHFDAATEVKLPASEPVGLGFSPGDALVPEPYVYVSASSDARSREAAFWNAPFGAVRRRSELAGLPDPAAACREFLGTGLDLASSVPSRS